MPADDAANSLTPLKPPFDPEIAEILALYPQRNGYLLSLFRSFAHSKRFLQKGVPNLLDQESPLSLRQREIVILRVCALRDCAYEWGVHAAIFAGAARFTATQIAATRRGAPDDPAWAPDEALLIEAVDGFIQEGGLGEAVKARFQAVFTAEEQLEIIALCGAYQTVSLVARLAARPPEPFAAPFPEGA
ncbi:MAG: carboxymuconolactone decarboxylase family protein [Pseudomonadota bacterium]